MFNIKDYLEKFKKISITRDFLIETTKITIKEITGVDIEAKNITIKNFSARISDKPAIKTQIFLNKEKIIKALTEKTNGKIVEIEL